LQDYNVVVWKKDAEIFLATHLEVKFDFSNGKTLNHKVIQNQHANTLVKENIIQLTHCVCKMALQCQKIARKVAKNTYEAKPPSTKMLLSH